MGTKDSHHNPKIYSVIAIRTKNWFSAIGIFSEFQRCKGKVALGSVSRFSVKRSLSHVLNCYSCAKYLSWSLSLIMAKRKIHFMNSALSIPRTFSCALDTFLEKTSCSFFPHLSNLAVTIEFTELLFSTCSRCCRNHCHLIVFLVDVFDRKWVNRQGSEMEDDVQPKIGLVFITMREWFPCHLKEVSVLMNALSVVKRFYFCTKISTLIQITKSVK